MHLKGDISLSVCPGLVLKLALERFLFQWLGGWSPLKEALATKLEKLVAIDSGSGDTDP